MEKEFIPYEQALELKELGFDDYNIAWYAIIDEKPKIVFLNYGSHLCAPLYQQAFRWFREKHNCHQYIQKFEDTFFLCIKDNDKFWSADRYNNYEEAELACLKKLIEIVKNERK